MADEAKCDIESALNLLLNVTKESGNLRNDLKKDILTSVSNIRKVLSIMNNEIDVQKQVISDLKLQVKKAEDRNMAGRGAFKHIMQAATSRSCHWSHAVAGSSRQWEATPAGAMQNYNTAVSVNPSDERKYKLFLKSKLKESPEAMKVVLKSKISPTKLKVGISAMKGLRDGRLLIESKSKEEIELLEKEISEQCSQLFEVNSAKLWKPSVIIFNVPEDLTTETAAETIMAQNPELNLSEGSITPKFTFKAKNNSHNLVAEVTPECWRVIAKKKLKIGWQVCNVDNYIKINRCFKCSKYNHRAKDCTGEAACPHCSENHSLKECTANKNAYKCINCMNYNKHTDDKYDENHSSMNKSCPYMQGLIRKYIQNTEY